MSTNYTIAVLDATGVQGAAVAGALLANGTFSVRAITDDASSVKAVELALVGAEVIEASTGDEASLRKAFEGAYGAFLVTHESDYESEEAAMVDVEKLIRAVRAADVPRLFWSTLETSAYGPGGLEKAVLSSFIGLLDD